MNVQQFLTFLDRTVDADPSTVDPAQIFAAVAALDLEPGAPVLIALPNGRTMLSTFFAVLVAGAVPVPLAPASTAFRITSVAERLGASMLIAPRIDPSRYGASETFALPGAEAVRFAGVQQRYESGDVILMTSGTAGVGTGCLHSFDALLRNATRHADAIGQRSTDTVLLCLPLHYSYALVAQAFAALVRGSQLIISGPPFTARAYAEEVAAHDVTVSSLTPSAATRLSEVPSTLRVLTVGGDTLDPAHLKTLLGADRELYLTYGLTEAGPRVSTLAVHAEPEHRWTSVGRPLPDVQTSLVNDELHVASDTVLRRRLPDGAPSPLTAAGAVATGDRFEIDADGYHFFRGRLTDSVVVGGEKVWLPSVRRIATAVPGVQHCRTTVYRDDRDQLRYDLEVSVDDPGPQQAAEIQRALNRMLLRSERPHRITLRAAAEEGWHK
ncbi:acyl--CoA ligase [Kribbella sandramycini]|uniref:Acyl--CoA ligase n=1 Tax=Kribbella sandramycini TaxID=60450 RepID=A0A7Y4L3H2_9ACTN|nr:class I adenylate-forming enzyme family protein [Kribbella sandramycini]MBB6566599.1 acyl-CoA synthetase (AMP-forming)/AMP-acid ligase II [Kribbella sandramycini]NOL42746.1 acyl--CoA ligase [Kribbella sandramycini]